MRLIYLSAYPFPQTADGQWHVDSKALSGVMSYAQHWPGEIVIASPGRSNYTAKTPRPGMTELLPASQIPVEVVEVPPFDSPTEQVAALHELRPSVVLTLLHLQARHLPRELPTVFTAEVDLRIRRELMAALESTAVEKLKMQLGLLRRETTYISMVSTARGLQCNGPVAFHAYGRFNRRSLEFMDHRITKQDVHLAAEVDPWSGDRPLSLGFSGRWTAIKGPQFAVDAANLISETHPGTTLTMFGGGELEDSLRSSASEAVTFAGFVDFESEWKPRVRRDIDLMLMPHVQGDPSCTYFETVGCGAPFIGFRQGTSTHLVRTLGVGWTTQQRTAAAMADVITGIYNNPKSYQRTRARGLETVAARDFNETSRVRTEHLIACAATP